MAGPQRSQARGLRAGAWPDPKDERALGGPWSGEGPAFNAHVKGHSGGH